MALQLITCFFPVNSLVMLLHNNAVYGTSQDTSVQLYIYQRTIFVDSFSVSTLMSDVSDNVLDNLPLCIFVLLDCSVRNIAFTV